MRQRRKISLIGAGNIGSTIAHLIVRESLADVALLDIKEGLPQGKALDLMHASPIDGADVNILGTSSYDDTHDSDIIVITAGITRKPGMSRDDLLMINAKIIKDVAVNCAKYSPKAKVIVVSNPLDVMTHLTYKAGGFNRYDVMGMAGVLDSARFSSFVAKAANVSVSDVNTVVLGGHGDTMIPLVRYCTISGIPVTKFLDKDKLNQIVQRTRFAGGEIVRILKTSAYYSPATSVVSMIKAIFFDKRRVITCAAYINGEYGLNDLYIGVPVILGKGGVQKVIELELSEDEKSVLHKTAGTIKTLINRVMS